MCVCARVCVCSCHLSSLFVVQSRCEAILRAQPQSRVAKELHLASVDAQEEAEIKKMKNTAAASVGVAAAIGVAAGVVSLLLKK